MHTSFTEYFVDPVTKEPLKLEITASRGDFVDAGYLKSSTGTYPIVRGIPRFVDFEISNYSKSFGYQWQKWPRIQFEAENVGRPMEGHTRKMWEKITGNETTGRSLEGQLVVDMGCGPGRFVDVARTKGARVIGVDYSAAVEAAQMNFGDDPNVCICQADALNLPLRPASVDGVFTIGVLHHTPDPERGVRQAWNILKANGWFAIHVYERRGYYDYTAVQLWRKLFKVMWPAFRQYPPLMYSYVTVLLFRPLALFSPTFGKFICNFFPFIILPDFRWALLDTFDSVTPSYQSAHESYEVFSWLKKAGYSDIEPTNWGFTSYRGVKKV